MCAQTIQNKKISHNEMTAVLQGKGISCSDTSVTNSNFEKSYHYYTNTEIYLLLAYSNYLEQISHSITLIPEKHYRSNTWQ